MFFFIYKFWTEKRGKWNATFILVIYSLLELQKIIMINYFCFRNHTKSLLKNIQSLHQEKPFSDLQIFCGDGVVAGNFQNSELKTENVVSETGLGLNIQEGGLGGVTIQDIGLEMDGEEGVSSSHWSRLMRECQLYQDWIKMEYFFVQFVVI